MGESYLQRKVFNKIRRRQQNNINLSSSISSTAMNSNMKALSTESSSIEEGRRSEECAIKSLPQVNETNNIIDSNDTPLITRTATPTSSSSTPYLSELARNESLESTITTCSSSACSATLGGGGGGGRSRSSRDKQLQSNGIGSSANKHYIRLKNASRAIFLLRRFGSKRAHTLLGEMSQESSGSQDQQQQQQQVSQQIPQLIVPKMNTLKLPLVCLIRSLDGELMREVFVHPYELGQYLIESLKVSVGITDSKYFGLKLAKSHEDQEDPRNQWLDLNESVCKQIKSSLSKQHFSHSTSNPMRSSSSSSSPRSIDFYLRIKFYPPNLARVQDQFLRNYLWLQLRRDLRLGKLTSSMNNLTLLMACVLQYELGDYKPELTEKIPELSILPNQDLIEEQAITLWATRLSGQKRHQAQMQFLRAAVILETYGFDYYPVRDHQRQRAYLLGFNYAGLKTIRNGRIVHHFSWHSISKISYERRMIIFHIYPTENSKRKQVLGFKCLSNEHCQSLYMRLLEQKYFFTVDLAYFDKSVRRPSCLHSSDEPNEWTLFASDESPVVGPPLAEFREGLSLEQDQAPQAASYSVLSRPACSDSNFDTTNYSQDYSQHTRSRNLRLLQRQRATSLSCLETIGEPSGSESQMEPLLAPTTPDQMLHDLSGSFEEEEREKLVANQLHPQANLSSQLIVASSLAQARQQLPRLILPSFCLLLIALLLTLILRYTTRNISLSSLIELLTISESSSSV